MPPIPKRLIAGLLLVAGGQTLILIHWLPFSYYYFPIIWFGFILTLDGGLEAAGRPSLWTDSRAVFLTLIPASAGFWWLFELFDQVVHNWRYIGGGAFTGLAFVALATVCFSTVLLAVWETALVISAVWDGRGGGFRPRSQNDDGPVGLSLLRSLRAETFGRRESPKSLVRACILIASFGAGILCVLLPIAFPHYAFGLIWGSLFLIVDPLNAWMGSPSLLQEVLDGRFSRAVTFALSALICGFFWEFWNYWAVVKWVYSVPYVSQLHLFEMPLPGYLGYLPFGLEAFAVTVFCLGVLRIVAARLGQSALGGPTAPRATEPVPARQ